ncbi:MAG: AraC family transcriptional regulator [Odoribacter sp.]
MGTLNTLLNIMFHFTPFGALLCAILLFMRRKDSDKARIVLAVSFASWGILMLGSTIHHYSDTIDTTKEIFSLISLNITVFVTFIMTLYPIAIINPDKQSIKNIFILFLPYILINVFLLLSTPEFRKFTSVEEIFLHFTKYDILLRFGFVVYMIIISFFVFYLPYKHTRSRVNLHWIHGYCLGMIGVIFFYTIWLFIGSDITRLLLQIYCLSFCLVMTYQELYIRLAFPLYEPIPTKENTTTKTISPLQQKLLQLLEEQSIWRNPDLTIIELATLLGTNRTTLSKTIKESGFDGFYDLINTYRIKEFIYIIEHQKINGIHETFFDVGFRSKVTATRYFRQQTGSTPSEYLQHVLLNTK